MSYPLITGKCLLYAMSGKFSLYRVDLTGNVSSSAASVICISWPTGLFIATQCRGTGPDFNPSVYREFTVALQPA